jgi:hypothetical protein
MIAAKRTSGCRRLSCSIKGGRNNSPDCATGGFGPIETSQNLQEIEGDYHETLQIRTA